MPNLRSPGTGRGAADDAAIGSLPGGLAGLSWGLPRTFLGLDEATSDFASARALILPVPYEATTSWGTGTRYGPRAILDASHYVELYDNELDAEPCRAGIHTLPSLELTRDGPAAALAELEEAWGAVYDAAEGRFVTMLGGEHSISSAAIRAAAVRDPERLSVLQFDAHADLRASHDGSRFSHACAMTRVVDYADIVAVGLRGVSLEEMEVARREPGVTLIFADEMEQDETWMDRALDALGPLVYLTFDVDYFDPSLVPSTGTPEPGGGAWYPTLRFLRRVFAERRVMAADVVELAPIPGLRAPDFLVARLVYKLISYAIAARPS